MIALAITLLKCQDIIYYIVVRYYLSAVIFMNNNDWYLEYEILEDRPGLLGDISSLLGMLSISIMKISGIDLTRRGMLLSSQRKSHIKRLESILPRMGTIRLLKLRQPKLRDRLAIRHGKYIKRDATNKKVYQFIRNELGILVDFLAEKFKYSGHRLIGIRGMPRVGKTESIVAASVCANKKWLFVSSTLLKQTIRNQLIKEEYNKNNLFIFDGIVSTRRASEKHWQLVREVMALPAVKVVEHPDIFVQNSEYSIDDFDCIVELRNNPEEEITYELIEQNNFFANFHNGGFDF